MDNNRIFDINFFDQSEIQTIFENGTINQSEKIIFETMLIINSTNSLKTLNSRAEFLDSTLQNCSRDLTKSFFKFTSMDESAISSIASFFTSCRFDLAINCDEIRSVFIKSTIYRNIIEGKAISGSDFERDDIAYSEAIKMIINGNVQGAISFFKNYLSSDECNLYVLVKCDQVEDFINALWKIKDTYNLKEDIKYFCRLAIDYENKLKYKYSKNSSFNPLNRLLSLCIEDGEYEEAIKACKIGIKYNIKGISESKLKQIEKKASENESKKR